MGELINIMKSMQTNLPIADRLNINTHTFETDDYPDIIQDDHDYSNYDDLDAGSTEGIFYHQDCGDR